MLVLVTLLCTLLALVSPAASAEPIRYHLAISDDLSEVQVMIRLAEDDRPLSASDGEANRLSGLESCAGEPVDVHRGRILSGGLSCIRYRHPLTVQSGRRSPPVLRNVLVTSPGEWLWVPSLGADELIQIRIDGPAGMAVSVPWTPAGPGTYLLGMSPGSSTGTAIFGDFRERRLAVGEAELRVALLDGPGMMLDEEKTLAWLAGAAGDVQAVNGRFPNPAPQVIVQPVRSQGRSPVPFGFVIRDGGETVRFFVDPDRSLEDYLADWTATHEFAHLLLPYVRGREKWVSEGFASYYQNVLLARRGIYTEEEAWWRLVRSFARADEVADPPALDQLHRRSFRDVRMLVYWSGAALALVADTRLRELSDGTESLDTVLGRMNQCCLPSGETWTAERLFAKLDDLTNTQVFMPLYREFMAMRGMPDMQTLYEDLGIIPQAAGVRLVSRGRLAGVREAIMSADNRGHGK